MDFPAPRRAAPLSTPPRIQCDSSKGNISVIVSSDSKVLPEPSQSPKVSHSYTVFMWLPYSWPALKQTS